MNCLVAWNYLKIDVLSCYQLVTDPGVINLNHFFALFLRVIANTLYLAWSDTTCNLIIKSLKWSRWSWGLALPSYALMFESLNPSSNSASWISLQKGDSPASATSSSSCSSLVAITRRRSSNNMFLNPLEFGYVCTLWVMEFWEHSYSRLLLRVSLMSTPLTFPIVLLPWLLPFTLPQSVLCFCLILASGNV